MGMELVGACSPPMREQLAEMAAWHQRRADLIFAGQPSPYIFYTNLYAAGQEHTLAPGTPTQVSALQALVAATCALVYGADTQRTVLTAGILEGPIGCRPQGWHYDYRGNTENIFIPLVPLTARNGTEYVDFGSLAQSAANRAAVLAFILQRGAAGDDLLTLPPLPIADSYRVRRLNAEPYKIVRMHSHALHRGVRNEESYTRRVFFIASTDQPDYHLDEAYLAPIIVDDGT